MPRRIDPARVRAVTARVARILQLREPLYWSRSTAHAVDRFRDRLAAIDDDATEGERIKKMEAALVAFDRELSPRRRKKTPA